MYYVSVSLYSKECIFCSTNKEESFEHFSSYEQIKDKNYYYAKYHTFIDNRSSEFNSISEESQESIMILAPKEKNRWFPSTIS